MYIAVLRGDVKLFVFTYYGCQRIKCKYAIFSVKWFTTIRFNIVISFIYFNMELLRKDNIPFILWSWYHPWSACKWVEMFSSYVNIANVRVLLVDSSRVSKTNFWILILHIFIHLKSQGCRLLIVYLWYDSHWNVGNP
jgi:hypothetical protein